MNILEYENNQEIKIHGNPFFPFNIYLCSIPLDFPSVSVHWHNDMEIIYIKKGSGLIRVDLTMYQVSAGDIILVFPGQLHSIMQNLDNIMEYENIIFRLQLLISKQNDICNERYFLPLIENKIILPSYISTKNRHSKKLKNHLDSIDELSKLKEDEYPMAIKGELFLFFYYLFTSFEKIMPCLIVDKSLDRLKIILTYIENNYAEKISITDIASAAGFSNSHFMKFFRKNMDISFVDFLNDFRLTMAAKLLLSSTDAVIDIASETGFENISYFNRLFKRKYHCTPCEFRKQEKPSNPFKYIDKSLTKY